MIIVTLIITLPLLAWGLVWGYKRLKRYYLEDSGLFVLRKIDIQAGVTITSDLVREHLKLREGMPLFAGDLAERRKKYMADAPTIHSLTITRILPDRISVTLVEREPLARLALQPLTVTATAVSSCATMASRPCPASPAIHPATSRAHRSRA